MSITTEIQRLHTNIGSIRETTDSILATIANKGVNVPSDTKLADVPSLITRIPGSGLPVSGSVELFGKTYPTITINGLEWICENLDYQWSGLSIGHNTTSAQACYVQDDETTWGWDGRRCGLLYNNAAMKYLQETILADSEWRVCTLDDLNSLSNVIYDYWNVGYHLTKTETWGTLTGDDKVGFNGKPCGGISSNEWLGIGNSVYINVYDSSSAKRMAYYRTFEEDPLVFMNGTYNGNWYVPIRLCRNARTNSAVIGGKAYRTVKMPDGKVWLAENLDYKFCNIGGSIDPTTPNAWYYNNDESTY